MGGRENRCKKVLINPKKSCTQSLKHFLRLVTVIEIGKLVLIFFVNLQLIVYFSIFSYGCLGRIYVNGSLMCVLEDDIPIKRKPENTQGLINI